MDSISFTSILLIVLVYFPGYLFKRFYYSGSFTRQIGLGDIIERIFTSLFWGFWIQVLALVITKTFYSLDDNSILDVFNTVKVSIETSTIDNKLKPFLNLNNISSYLAFTCLLSVLLGFFAHHLVRITQLDVRVKVLRFANRWHYYFRGEIRKDLSFYNAKGKVISTEADVLVDMGDGNTCLYSGFLSEYMISASDGGLESITLTAAKRYSRSANNFKIVQGDCLVIPYGKVVNINLRYQVKQRTIPLLKLVLQQSVYFLINVSIIAIPIYVSYHYYSSTNIFLLIISNVFFIITWILLLIIPIDFYLLNKPKDLKISNKAFRLFYLLLATITFSLGMICVNNNIIKLYNFITQFIGSLFENF